MRWWEWPRRALKGAVRLSMLGLTRGPHITRHYMYKRLATVLNGQTPGPVLSISESLPLCRVLGLDVNHAVEANYPEANILNLPFPDGRFAYVVSDQVLEHVEGTPQRAIVTVHQQ
ncbi:MAG: methyltransferase domain-containing protein [Armatimonadota bacterium]